MTVQRIALLFEFSTLNGGERSMLAALEWLNQHDTRFEFVAIAPCTGRLADALHDRSVRVVNWSLCDAAGRRLSMEEIQASLQNIVMTVRSDLLHANSLAMGRLVGSISRRLSIPTTAHLRDIIKLSSAAVNDLNNIVKLIAVSNATRNFHIAQGIDENRVTTVHNGVDLDRFQPRRPSGQLRNQFDPPRQLASPSGPSTFTPHSLDDNAEADGRRGERSPKLIASIGQIGLRKGQDVLASAAPMIVQQIPEAHFLLIGERNSTKQESVEFEQAIHSSFAASGLSDRLHCLGYQDNVAILLNEIDVLVHSANQEPFGRVLLEASASGVPIVATQVGGTAEIIVAGVTGHLVPPRNARALADAVIKILSNDVDAQNLRRAARERAVREFSIADAGLKLANVWTDCLQNHPR